MRAESPEMWRQIFAGMRAEDTTSWHLLWHLFAQSDNALTTAQLARRLHIPEPGVMRLMNKMGTDIAESTGWFSIPDPENGWQVYFTRSLNTNGEWLYSIKKSISPSSPPSKPPHNRHPKFFRLLLFPFHHIVRL